MDSHIKLTLWFLAASIATATAQDHITATETKRIKDVTAYVARTNKGRVRWVHDGKRLVLEPEEANGVTWTKYTIMDSISTNVAWAEIARLNLQTNAVTAISVKAKDSEKTEP